MPSLVSSVSLEFTQYHDIYEKTVVCQDVLESIRDAVLSNLYLPPFETLGGRYRKMYLVAESDVPKGRWVRVLSAGISGKTSKLSLEAEVEFQPNI